MSPIIFDSFALLALFREEKGHKKVFEILSGINTENPGYMSVINLGELYYITHRKQNSQQADLALSSALQLPIVYVDADFELTYEAAKLKSKFKLSYADAFAAALTILKKGTLLTDDSEFKNLVGVKNFKVEFINS